MSKSGAERVSLSKSNVNSPNMMSHPQTNKSMQKFLLEERTDDVMSQNIENN